eukprot:scaffold267945_cov33-Tisochrysis_lutea.AAC.2
MPIKNLWQRIHHPLSIKFEGSLMEIAQVKTNESNQLDHLAMQPGTKAQQCSVTTEDDMTKQ